MKKMQKVLAALLLLLIACIIGLLVLAKILITPERVKQTILPLAESYLNRDIEINNVQIGVFSGIELDGLKVFEHNGRALFVSTESVQLKYQFWPLLAMKVVFDEINIESPKIRVVRASDGTLNFEDLYQSRQKTEQQQNSALKTNSNPFDLLITKLKINNGHIDFVDEKISPERPLTLSVEDLSFDVKGVTLVGDVPLSLAFKVRDSVIEAEGTISLFEQSGQVRLQVQNFDVLTFKPYFQQNIPGQLERVTINVESDVSVKPSQVLAKGIIGSSNLDLILDAWPQTRYQDAHFAIGYDVKFDWLNTVFHMEKVDLDFNGVAAKASGTIKNFFADPDFDVVVTSTDLDLEKLALALPEGVRTEVEQFQPSGKLSLHVQLGGTLHNPKKLVKVGKLNFNKAQFSSHNLRPSVVGALHYSNERLISEDLFVELDGNNARVDLKARGFFSQIPVVEMNITSERFQLEPLLGLGGVASVPAKGQPGVVKTAKTVGARNIPLRATGVIKLKKALFRDLQIDEFAAEYQLREDLLTLSRFEGYLLGGALRSKAEINFGLQELAYHADIKLDSIQAEPLLSFLNPSLSKTLFGELDLNLELDGQGTRWETLRQTLDGHGDFSSSSGRLVQSPLIRNFTRFLSLSDVDEIPFESYSGKIKIRNGAVILDSQLSSDHFRLFPKGTIGLEGSLNLNMDTRLSPDLASKFDQYGKITNYLTDDRGWTQIPLLISGHYENPKFSVDPKALEQKAKKVLQQELNRHLEKFLTRPNREETNKDKNEGKGSSAAPKSGEELLQDALKNFLGN